MATPNDSSVVDPVAPSSSVEIAERMASFGLAYAHDRSPVSVDEGWPVFLRYLAAQRLTGLAVAAWSAGELLVTDDRRRDLFREHRAAMMRALRIEATCVAMMDALSEAGVRAVTLKGVALSHSIYGDPSWRAFGDLDLLVQTSDWGPAQDVLQKHGWTRKTPEPRPGFDVRFGKGATFSSTSGIEIDLHRTLAPGPFGLSLDLDELAAATAFFRIGGRFFERLDDDAAFVHSCLHAVLAPAPSRLVPLRDVAQSLEAAELDWNRIAGWGDRWGVEAVIHEALALVVGRLGMPLPDEAAAYLHSTVVATRARRRIDAYRSSRRWKGGVAVASLSAIKGIRAKAAYVYALGFPVRRFAEVRSGGGRSRYLHRWGIPLRWALGRTGRRSSGPDRVSTSAAPRELQRGPDVAA